MANSQWPVYGRVTALYVLAAGRHRACHVAAREPRQQGGSRRHCHNYHDLSHT